MGRLIETHSEDQANREMRQRHAFSALSDRGPNPRYVFKNWQKPYDEAEKFAHAATKPRPDEADREWVEKFLELEGALMAFSKPSYENMDDLDRLLDRAHRRVNGWAAPSVADLGELARLVARFENRVYFYDRLENPEWVPALAKRGVFDDPPNPVEIDEDGSVQFPPWPEGRFLARIAPVASDAVAAVLGSLSPSANPFVTRILLEAAQALPDEQFRRLAPRAVEWITASEATTFVDHFAEEAAHVIARLAHAGKVRQARKAAKKLLWIERRSGASNGSPSDDILGVPPEPVGRLSDWAYARAVEQILPDLVDSAGMEALRLFSSLLSVAVRFSKREDEPSESDGLSAIWRPAIEDHSQNLDRGVRCILVTAVRDAAVRLAKVSDEDMRAVVEVLEAGTLLHRRIALHVLAVVPGSAEMAEERIVNRDVFDERHVKHEYAELLRSRLGEVSSEGRRTVLDWVLAGPDLEEFRRLYSSASPEDEVAYVEIWKRDWLSIVADHLAGADMERYRELVAKRGEAEHPDFVSWIETGFGDRTPLSAEDMNEMSADSVIEYLATWEPDEGAGWGFGASMRGLGRTFEAAVTHRVADFAAVANRIETLDPTYVRSFLSGFEAAVKAGASVPWDQPIRLIASALEHPFENDDDTLSHDRDPGWSWTRGQAASLIREGVADRDNRIPFELRQSVWSVLESLTRDPHPTPADETTAAGYSSMDPYTQSINTNRGKAMHAVVAYALWCRRELDAHNIDAAEGFDLIPEVRTVLDEHLNPETDPSLAVRSVYGKWLPWLILLDERWVAANITRILPRAAELAVLRDAAWNTYIGWCPPFNQVYDALRHEYEAAVDRVPSEGTVGFTGDERADAKLGEHLVTFHGRGCLQPALLERWFDRVDDELAARVMDFLGRSLNNTEGDIDPPVLQRIRQLWDARLQAIAQEPEAHKNEADAFAYTFASAKLDDDWSLAGLEITLRPAGPRWSGRPVIGRLAEMADTKPAEATRCTLRMLKGTVNDWDHLGWRDQVSDVLAATHHTTDPEAIENRNAIVDHYVTRGDHDFRDYTRAEL